MKISERLKVALIPQYVKSDSLSTAVGSTPPTRRKYQVVERLRDFETGDFMEAVFCLWCGQKRPNNIVERMHDRPCNSPDGDGHLYSLVLKNVCNMFQHYYIDGVCSRCGTPTIEKLKQISAEFERDNHENQ